MLPPWFSAPLGSQQFCRHYLQTTSNALVTEHLHFTFDNQRRVPVGYQAVITHAFIGLTLLKVSVEWENYDYEGCYWQLFDQDIGTCLTPRLPHYYATGTADWFAAASAINELAQVSIPCPPLISPVVVDEGRRVLVRSVNSQGSRPTHYGWISGFIMPKVNEVPGAKRFFTETIG